MNLDALLPLLLGAGGAGGIAGLYNLVALARKGKLENEETLIKRLVEDNKRQNERADAAEKERNEMRARRDEALDKSAVLRRDIIATHGMLYLRELEEKGGDYGPSRHGTTS